MRREISGALVALILSACTHSSPREAPSVASAPLNTAMQQSVHDTIRLTDTVVVTDTVRLSPEKRFALATSAPSNRGGGTLDHLPTDGDKPDPVAHSYETCPDSGSDPGSPFDPTLNRRKNRIDDPADGDGYIDAAPAAITENKPRRQLPKYRRDWSDSQTAWVAKWEGEAVNVDGYLSVDRRQRKTVYGAKQEGEESTNCEDGAPNVDFHIWLTPDTGQDRTHAIVVEMTPRIRKPTAAVRGR